MKVQAPLCLIKNVKKGTAIGYNRTYTANNDMKVAIIQVGYADAIPLEFSNNGYVEYEGKKLNILGKVSMDLICICIDGIDIKKGDSFYCKNIEISSITNLLSKTLNIKLIFHGITLIDLLIPLHESLSYW